jgi:hypothetical protein
MMAAAVRNSLAIVLNFFKLLTIAMLKLPQKTYSFEDHLTGFLILNW